MATYAIAANGTTPPSGAGTPVIVYLLGGALAGGLVPTASAAYKAWRRGKKPGLNEDDEMVARITALTLEGSKGMLEEYRIELEIAKRQLATDRDQLERLNRSLGESEARITRLEADLAAAKKEADTLRIRLNDAVAVRARLRTEVEGLRKRIVQLEGIPGATPDGA